jgi:hypothetical protein
MTTASMFSPPKQKILAGWERGYNVPTPAVLKVVEDYVAAVRLVDNTPFVLKPDARAQALKDLRAEFDAKYEIAKAKAALEAAAPFDRQANELRTDAERLARSSISAATEARCARFAGRVREAADVATIEAVIGEATLTEPDDSVRALYDAGVARVKVLTTQSGGRFAAPSVAARVKEASQAFELRARHWSESNPPLPARLRALERQAATAVAQVEESVEFTKRMMLGK